MTVDRHWQLFTDWCAATDRAALPATADTVTAFLHDLPAGPATRRRRLATIHAAHRTAGLPSPCERPTASPPRLPPALVAGALADSQVRGWPGGLVGQRDAAIVAVTGAGLTRRQVQQLRITDARPPQVATDPHPGRCPACAHHRWKSTALIAAQAGWRVVRNQMAEQYDGLAADELEHACTSDPPDGRPPGWLFTPIDRHGVPQTDWPLSRRSITAVLAVRLLCLPAAIADDRPAEAGRAVPDLDTRLRQRAAATAALDRYTPHLDDVDRLADDVLARVATALDGSD